MQRQPAVARASWRRVLSAQRKRSLLVSDASLPSSSRPRALFPSPQPAAINDRTAASTWLAPSPRGWGLGQAFRGLATTRRASTDTAAPARSARAYSAEDVAALLPPSQSNSFYDRAVRKALDRGDLPLATAMLRRLRELEPDRPVLLLHTYNQLLYLLGQQQQQQQQQRKRGELLEQTLRVLDEMRAFQRVSSRSFNTALAACSRARDVHKARRVLGQMKAARKTPGAFAYATAIQACARKRGDITAAEELFKQMIADGIEPSIEAVRAMLSVYSRGPDRADQMLATCDRARELFDVPLDAASTDMVARYLLQSGEAPRAVEFLRRATGESGGGAAASVASRTWAAVLDACRKLQNPGLVEQVERMMSDYRANSRASVRKDQIDAGSATKEDKVGASVSKTGDADVWGPRLARLAALNDVEAAVPLLDKMLRHQAADTRSVDAVLAGCSRCDSLELAEAVLRMLQRHFRSQSPPQPSILGYNAVLNCCATRGDFSRAERYFQELYGKGLAPDLVTLNTMLKALATSCDHEDDKRRPLTRSTQAMALYDWATRDLGLAPSAITLFTLLQVFTHDLTHESARGLSPSDEQTCEQMARFFERLCQEAPRQAMDVGVCNAAIDYHLRVGDAHRALSMLDVMHARGVSVDDATFGLVFAAASAMDDAEIGLRFLQRAMDAYDYQPTLRVMNGAIELCAATEDPGGASELLDSMEASGRLTPDAQTYAQVTRSLARVGNVQGAWRAARAMKDRLGYCSLDAYNRVLQACAVSGQPERALDVLAEMTQQEGVAPDGVTYDMVLKAFVKAGARDAKRARSFQADSSDADTEDESETFREERHHVPETRSTQVRDVVLGLLEEMQQYGIAPSSLTYSRAVSACAVRGDGEGVMMVFDDLLDARKRRADPAPSLLSAVALSEYIKACRASQSSQRLLDLARVLKDDVKRSEHPAAASARVLLELMNAFESVGEWHQALRMLRTMDTAYGVRPSALLFNRAMEMCNAAGEHAAVQLVFLTMQNSPAYLVDPTVGSYIQAIYAAEQLEEWTRATNLFLAMQHNCPKEEIRPADLQKIALGRYSERTRHDLDEDRGSARSS